MSLTYEPASEPLHIAVRDVQFLPPREGVGKKGRGMVRVLRDLLDAGADVTEPLLAAGTLPTGTEVERSQDHVRQSSHLIQNLCVSKLKSGPKLCEPKLKSDRSYVSQI